MTNPEPTTIRSDLWPTMSVSQLNQQMDLVITQIAQLHSIMGPSSSLSIHNMYGALQTALQDLNALIDNKGSKHL